MTKKVDLRAEYPFSPELVWQALTDPASVSKWLLPTDFKPLIGFRFRLDRPDGTTIKGKVLEAEPAKLLSYTWDEGEDGQTAMVVWTLQPKGAGTEVRLEQVMIEEPVVNCIAVDNYFNWLYALRHGLPGMLALLSRQAGRQPVPITYVEEEVAV